MTKWNSIFAKQRIRHEWEARWPQLQWLSARKPNRQDLLDKKGWCRFCQCSMPIEALWIITAKATISGGIMRGQKACMNREACRFQESVRT